MSDHHVDSMHIDYSKAAEHILKQHGLFIASAPPVNHKPGNDFWSDFWYPFPLWPDNRFRNPYEEDKVIKDPPKKPKPAHHGGAPYGKDFQLPSEEIQRLRCIKNPIITYRDQDRYSFIDKATSPYTGLVLQANEKRAFDVSFVKPYYKDGQRKTKLIIKEVVVGHYVSIATYDGWKYHIYRGVVMDIMKVDPLTKNGKRLRPTTTPFGHPMMEEDLKKNRRTAEDVVERNVRIILDGSYPVHSDLVSIPLTQVIDIQAYNHVYDFTIYEGGLKVFWDDWATVKDKRDEKHFTYIPEGDIAPQNLYHEVIEHQKAQRADVMKISDELEAVQYRKNTLFFLIDRLNKFHTKANYEHDTGNIIIYNYSKNDYELINLNEWVIFDTDLEAVLEIIPDKEFKRRYKKQSPIL